MNYEKVVKLFTTMRTMMSAECGLPAQQGRNKRNTDLLLLFFSVVLMTQLPSGTSISCVRRKTFTATSSPRVGPRQITDSIIFTIPFLTTKMVFSKVQIVI